ncbi:hypothetical protein NKI94_19235 [Mesorhizobium australicum]|uniref:hypothetical protein n=1 Tax=Mesorhizobium australicum TaxID=536018 RepID=UPI003336564F
MLLAIKPKVAVSDHLPLAIAARGNWAFGDLVSRQIIRAAESIGFDEMLLGLDEAMQSFASEKRLDVLIAGVSETAGPMHRRFCNWQQPGGGLAPLTLVDPGFYLGFGSDGRPNGLKDMGIPAPREGEFWQTHLSRHALHVFEFFRRIPVPIDPDDANTERAHLIGGHLDMTIVARDQVTVRQMHTWPEDKVGQKIDPFCGVAQIIYGSNTELRAAA